MIARVGLLVAVAFLLRIALVVALDTPRAAEAGDAWAWGHEAACLAQSLREHDTYGDPWGKGTGASSWLTPVFPSVLAALIELGGGVTRQSAWLLAIVQSALSAATCAILVAIGAALARPRVGWVAGWLFAFYPPALWNAADTVWDTTTVAFALALFLWLFLRHAPRLSLAAFALLGAGFGLVLFLNPAPVTLVPAIVAWICLRTRDARRAATLTAVFVAGAFAVCAPWMTRNLNVLGTFALRPNFGVEMRLGNNPVSTGRPVPFRHHPSHVPEELALYRELGERDYAADCMQRALAWIRANPGRFAWLTVRRIQYFWLGDPPVLDSRTSGDLGARADWKAWFKFLSFGLAGLGALIALARLDLAASERALLTLALASFGLPYFATHVSERYRFPIDPWVVLLDAALLVGLWTRARKTS